MSLFYALFLSPRGYLCSQCFRLAKTSNLFLCHFRVDLACVVLVKALGKQTTYANCIRSLTIDNPEELSHLNAHLRRYFTWSSIYLIYS